MLMSLGLFVFERATVPFQNRDRRTDWRHAESERIGAHPAIQFLGPGRDEISLTGVLLPEVAGRHGELRRLRDMADQGEAWPLVDGNGLVIGNFVIAAIDERASEFMDNGVPRKADFTISLKRVS